VIYHPTTCCCKINEEEEVCNTGNIYRILKIYYCVAGYEGGLGDPP
jgi:hypothetical protein